MTEQGPKAFKIVQILDKTTFVISGEGVGDLREGEKLSVLAFGGEVPPTNTPLVLVKAHLEATSVTNAYAIARTPMEVREETISALAALAGGTRTVRVRPQLKVEATEERGNPAGEGIKTGDVVIRSDDYRAYVDSLSISPG